MGPDGARASSADFDVVLAEVRLGRLDEALRRALILYYARGGDPMSTSFVANLLSDLGRPAEALEMVELSQRAHPGNDAAVLAGANALAELRRHREAATYILPRVYERVARSLLLRVVRRALDEGLRGTAGAIARRALAVLPGDADLWCLNAASGGEGAGEGACGPARVRAERALRLDASNAEAWRIRLLSRLNDAGDERRGADCRRLMALVPDRWDAYFASFRSLTSDMGGPVTGDALEAIRRANRVAPGRAAVTFVGVEALSLAGRGVDAAALGSTIPAVAGGLAAEFLSHPETLAGLPWARLVVLAAKRGLVPPRYRTARLLTVGDLPAFTGAVGAPCDRQVLPPSNPVDWRAFPSDFERFRSAVERLERRGVVLAPRLDFSVRWGGLRWPLIFDGGYILTDVLNEARADAWPSPSSSGHKVFCLGDMMPTINDGEPLQALLFEDGEVARSVHAGRGVFLPSVDNYGHYVIDFMTRVCAVAEVGGELSDLPILCAPLPSYAREMIALFGFGDRRFVEIPARVDEVTEFRDCALVGAVPYAAGFRWLRDRYRRLHPRREPGGGGARRRRIYLSRGELAAGKRRLANEDEVAQFLFREGFEVIHPSLLPVAEVAAAVRDAEIVVSPMGAGTSNLIFASPGCMFIELFNPAFQDSRWLSYSHTVLAYFGVDYRRVVGRALGSVRYDLDRIDHPFTVSINSLASVVRDAAAVVGARGGSR